MSIHCIVSKRRIFLTLFSLFFYFLTICGCGYRIADRLPSPSKIATTIAIPVLKNTTTTPRVEQILTRALIERFSENSTMNVSSEPQNGDFLFQGVVTSLNSSPILFGKEGFAHTFLLSIQTSVKITRKSDGKVILDQPSFLFRDQYQINPDVHQFFSEQNPAMERIARDFASSVVVLCMENLRHLN
jgi:hypothetical protein